MADIERVTAFKNIAPYLSSDEQTELARKLDIDSESLPQRLAGLTNEDEFCLILSYLESCNHVISFDEGISALTESYQPDLLIQLKDGRNIFVEVKSKAAGPALKISKGNLHKRIDFAKSFGFPLYFAVRLNELWGLYPSEVVADNSGKVHIVEHYDASVFSDFFGSTAFTFFAGLRFTRIYDLSNVSSETSEGNNPIAFEIHYGDNLVVRFARGEPEFFIDFLVGLIFDSISEEEVQASDSIRTVSRTLDVNILIPDYRFFTHQIGGIGNEYGSRYDATSYLKLFLKERKHLLNRSALLKAISYLEARGLPIIPTKFY